MKHILVHGKKCHLGVWVDRDPITGEQDWAYYITEYGPMRRLRVPDPYPSGKVNVDPEDYRRGYWNEAKVMFQDIESR
jgi:hypothetical protein